MNSRSQRVLCLYFANLDVNQIAKMLKDETKYSVVHRIRINGKEFVEQYVSPDIKKQIREGLDNYVSPQNMAKSLNLRSYLVLFIMRRLGWAYTKPIVRVKHKVRCQSCSGQYLKVMGSDEPCPYCETLDANSAARESNHRTNVRSREDREHLYPRDSEGTKQARDSEVHRRRLQAG